VPVRLPVDEKDLDRHLVAKGGLYKFMELGWEQIESEPFVHGWHLEEVCTHLEAVSRGEIRRLIINIPPGMGKSLSVSVFWQVWDWIKYPWRKFMFASFDAGLSQRDALRAKELIRSQWFQERWGFLADTKKLERMGLQPLSVLTGTKDRQDTATIYWSSGGGLRFSTSVGGKATGWHAHIQVVDDPTKPGEVTGGGNQARNALEKTRNWYRGTMSSRKANAETFARVIIMQRLHEADLAGQELETGDYIHLRLPMKAEMSSGCNCPSCQLGPCKTPWGGDRRTEEGELLCEARFSDRAVQETTKDMGSMTAGAQLQQRPSPEGGAIFQRAWMARRWRTLPAGIRLIQSWDCAFKDLDTSDWVVGQVWGQAIELVEDPETGKKTLPVSEYYLVDEVRDRMDLPTTCQAMVDLSRKWPRARLKLVEDKANGPAVEQTLRKKVPGIVLVNPQGGKVSRANAVAPYFEAGNILLPESSWVEDYIKELTDFPVGANDDRVDTTSQALLRLTGKARPRLKEAMQRLRNEQ
jgi:predicted phage terminase large subunit-like protein